MSTTPTVPILDPTGKVWDVPYENMHDALSQGGKMGVYVMGPDQKQYVIPADRVNDAVKAGGKVVPYNLDQSHQGEGFWKSFGSDLTGILKPQAQNPYPGMGQEQKAQAAIDARQEDQTRKSEGHGALYRAAAPVAGIVTNVPGMEKSAAEGDTSGVLGHAAAGATLAASPLALESIAKLGLKAADAVPSKARAVENFQDVMSVAKDKPVELANTQDAALKMIDWQKKTQLGPTVNKFLNRITNPKLGPLSYEEARDFSQLLGKLSAEDSSRLAPAVRFDLIRMVNGLKKDIGTTAEGVGKGAEYDAAMNEYRQASKLESGAKTAGKMVVKYALPGALGYTVGQLMRSH
jgi:hypothetical protein